MMPKTISSTELQKDTLAMIDWTRLQGTPVVIETYGKPIAALLSYDEYEAYWQYKQSRQARFAQLKQAAAQNADFNQLSEEEALALADEERQAIWDNSQQK